MTAGKLMATLAMLLLLSCSSASYRPSYESAETTTGLDAANPRVQDSGLSGLLKAAGAGIAYDYEPLRDAVYAIANADAIVAGYLTEIVDGVTEVDERVLLPKTEQEVQAALARTDATIARMEAEGASESFIAEARYIREKIAENKPPNPSPDREYAVFRVYVTEVFAGDIAVGDTLDVQVQLTILNDVDSLASQLQGTPRVVVGGTWGSESMDGSVLYGPDGSRVNSMFTPYVDLFWLDDADWDEGDGDEKDEPLERPSPNPEAIHLSGLHRMEPGWGTLSTLDDLAAALRAASVAPTPPPIGD